MKTVSTISVESFVKCLSNFPPTTGSIVISSGYIFSFENNILCFGEFPVPDLQLFSNFKNLSKILSVFDEGDLIRCYTEKDQSIKLSSKNSSVRIDSVAPDDHFISLIKNIEDTKNVSFLREKEDFKQNILLAASVARKDNLSGVLDCIYISVDGKIVSSDNVRALVISQEENIKHPITIKAKTAHTFFKTSNPDRIKIFKTREDSRNMDVWVSFFEELTGMHYCTKMPDIEKFPFQKFTSFFSDCRDGVGRSFTFPEETKETLKKIASFCEGKGFSKTATLTFRKGYVVCSTKIPNGVFKKKIKIKNDEEFSVVLNPELFSTIENGSEMKILKNAIYFRNNNVEYIMAIGG